MNPPAEQPAQRVESLDALRGFDMLWIIGADAVSGALLGLKAGPAVDFLGMEMEHSPWAGFTFYDLIFPLFVFIMGTSISLSVRKQVETQGHAGAIRRIFKRAALLYLLGLLFYGGLASGISHIRLLGVLQRLALCYAATALLSLALRPRTLLAVGAGLLLGYWALLRFVPVPGFGAFDLVEGHNLTNWIDAHYLPLHKWHGDHDPEGILSTLPSIASCILGFAAGTILQDPSRRPAAKSALLAGCGVACLCLGLLWGFEFPLIKKLWTSSFALVAGGWSLLLLAGFHQVIDVMGHKKWATPFLWIGSNALTIYLISHLVDFKGLSARFVGGELGALLNRVWPGLSDLALAATGIFLCVLVCRFLYAKRIFIRL